MDKQLYDAAMKGDAAAIERLAAEGASPDAKDDEDGMTALMHVALNGQVECVRALLDAGADRTLRCTAFGTRGWSRQGKTALEISGEGRGQLVRTFLEERGGAVSVVAQVRGVSVAEVERTLRGPSGWYHPQDEYAIFDAIDKKRAALESEARRALASDGELAARQKRFAEVAALLRE